MIGDVEWMVHWKNNRLNAFEDSNSIQKFPLDAATSTSNLTSPFRQSTQNRNN